MRRSTLGLTRGNSLNQPVPIDLTEAEPPFPSLGAQALAPYFGHVSHVAFARRLGLCTGHRDRARIELERLLLQSIERSPKHP